MKIYDILLLFYKMPVVETRKTPSFILSVAAITTVLKWTIRTVMSWHIHFSIQLEMCQYDTDVPTQGHPHPHSGILQKMKLKKGP